MTPTKHWRLSGAKSMTRSGWTLCGLSQDRHPSLQFTSQPRLITCETCSREKKLRAAVARARAAAVLA